jgi:hypothetical protein
LYGNNTDLTAEVTVATGTSLVIVGKWFASGNAEILWDGTYLDTATVDSTGYFSKIVTVPTADAGAHMITVSNGNTQFLVTVEISPVPVPADSDTSPTTTPSPTTSPSPTPSPSPSPTPSPTSSPQITPTPEPQPPEKSQISPYAIAVAIALALISAVAFILKKTLQQ